MTTSAWFNFKFELGMKMAQEVLLCQFHHQIFFYQSNRMSLDWPSWPGHVEIASTQFNFKLRLDKDSNKEVLRLTYYAEFNKNTILYDLNIVYYFLKN